MGANIFCLKACDPDYELGYRMCERECPARFGVPSLSWISCSRAIADASTADIYDRIGCNANAPAAYEEGVFETCLGDDQVRRDPIQPLLTTSAD